MEPHLEHISKFLNQFQAKNIAVQVHQSISDFTQAVLNILIQAFPQTRFFTIGDSALASCCSDFVSARHIQAQGIIHIGHLCQAPSKIPVLHIPDPFVADIQDLQKNSQQLPQKIFLQGQISQQTRRVVQRVLQQSQKFLTPSKEQAQGILAIGNGIVLSSIIQNAYQSVFILSKKGFQAFDAYNFISRRVHYINKVESSRVFGLIVVSIPVYKEINQKVKSMLRAHGKLVYTIYLGKINPQKLGNFDEIDMFVLISCSQKVLPDNREFYKPVITPFELETGLNGSWNGQYSLGLTRDEEVKNVQMQSIADRFSSRTFKGLDLAVGGKREIEEGYSGIASRYKSETRRTM